MENSNTIKKGIKSCYYAYEGQLKYSIKSGAELFIQAKKRHKFYLDENIAELFGENTVNKKATVQGAKWAFIFDMLFQKAADTPDNEIYQLWGDIGDPAKDRSIGKMGIGYQYKSGPSIEFVPDNEEDIWLGRKYRVEVFNEIPNKGFYFYFIPVGSPSIRFAYFEKQVIAESATKIGINEGYYSYGQTHILYLNTHLLPITVLPQNFKPQELGITMEMDSKHLQLEIYLTDEQFNNLREEPIVKEDLMQFYKTTVGANGQFEIPILIDPEWRDEIHKKAEKIKSYTFTIQIKNTKTGVNYPKNERFKVNLNGLKKINKDYTDYESFDVSPNLLVKYETQEEILHNYQLAKSNQIQYIGDINYTKREFDPCGYSQIIITDEANQNRKPFILFDEDKLTSGGDNTSQTFDVIRGDNTSNVIITLKNLHNKNVYCNGVMLPKNQKHNTKENVFLMDTVLAAKRLGDDFERVEDKDHKKQLRKSDIKITKENETDTDVITDPAKPEYEVEKVQNFVINKDYEYSGEDKLILKLNYIYNKSYDNEILNYLSQDQKILQYNEFGKLVANIWVVRYLIKLAKNKDFFQTYFVPVSTCRYPNQIVKVRVFPDMKWVLNFNYNIKEPLYYNDSPTQLDYFDRSKNEFDDLSGNIRRAEEASIKKRVASAYHNLKSGFAFSLDCEVSGEEPIHLSKAFSKKYRNTLKPIFDIIEFLDTTLGISKAKEEDERQTRTSASYVKRKGIRDLPVSFELKPPSLGLGIAIGYTTDKNYVQTWGIEGRIIAAPLIGAEVRLDLLALGSKIKPWGIILDALDIAAWAAETLSGGRLEVDYKIEIVFESEVNLVGRKTGEDEETKEPTYEKYGNIKYNFAEKGAIGDFGVQGIIKGKIEISFEIKIQAKVKNAKGTNIGDKHRMEDKGKIGMGAKAESYISLTIPTNCNAEGNLDVNCYFSGVKFEAWFKVSLSSKSTDEKPDISKQVVDEISFPQIIIL